MITIDPIKRPPRKSSTIDKDEIMKEVDLKFSNLVEGAPEKLDSIKELADAIENLPNLDNFPTKISDLENDSSFITLADVQTSLNKAETALQEEQFKGTISAVDTDASVDEPEMDYVTNEELNNVKQELSELGSEIHGNINYEKNKSISSLGTVYVQEGYGISYEIPINGGASVTFFYDSAGESRKIIAYDASGNFIDYWGGNSATSRTVSLPSNTTYIIYNFSLNDAIAKVVSNDYVLWEKDTIGGIKQYIESIEERQYLTDVNISKLQYDVNGGPNYEENFSLSGIGTKYFEEGYGLSYRIPVIGGNIISFYYDAFGGSRKIVEYREDGYMIDYWGGNNGNQRSITLNDSTAYIIYNFNLADETAKVVMGENVIWEKGITGGKQDRLVSGVNIKTINGKSILGEGDLVIKGGDTSSIIGLNPDSEYADKMANLKRAKTNSPLVLAHFSDIHNDGINLKRIIEWCDHHSENIDDIIFTGDATYNVYSDGMDFWNNSEGSENILFCMGNHDCSEGNGTISSNITAQMCYDRYYQNIGKWGVEYEVGKCYFFKDYVSANVRFIVIDYTHWDAEQETWLANTLEDARVNGYAVITAMHTNPLSITEEICSFTSLAYLGKSEAGGTTMASKIADFQRNGGEYIANLCGHTHYDRIGVLTSAPMLLQIQIDAARSQGNYMDKVRIIGQRSQDLFNIVSIDTTEKYIKIIRVGAKIDKYMRHAGELCYRYADYTNAQGVELKRGLVYNR